MTTPSLPLINLPPDSVQVTDADEEVFLLYSLLAASSSSSSAEQESGLGFVDSKRGEIIVSFDITPPSLNADVEPQHGMEKSKGRRRRPTAKLQQAERHIEVTLAQDVGGLMNRKGDTGSVLWRASIHLAQLLLQEHYFPPPFPTPPLLNPSILSQSHIVELGAGTGLLPILLSPLAKRYTATDQAALLPLLGKNVRSAGLGDGVHVEELNWVVLEGLSPERRTRYFPLDEPPDLVLCVDCLYNPSLLRPFLAAVSYFCPLPRPSSGKGDRSEDAEIHRAGTRVLVMSELRDPEVMRAFLQLWLEDGSWEVWRAGEGLIKGSRCVLWVGWRVLASAQG